MTTNQIKFEKLRMIAAGEPLSDHYYKNNTLRGESTLFQAIPEIFNEFLKRNINKLSNNN